MVTLTSIQAKEIISIESGERMGHILDLEIDVGVGKITHLIIGTSTSLTSFFNKQEEVSIPWSSIVTFGTDVILVKGLNIPE